MYERLKETAKCLKALRAEMHGAVPTSTIEELDQAIGELEAAIAEHESGQESARRAIKILDRVFRHIPQIAHLLDLMTR